MKLDAIEELSTSVVIPVYLAEATTVQIQWLRRALESAQDQTYPGKFEIIVVDDGSPTPVSEHAQALGASAAGVQWLRCPRNRGAVTALNVGLRAARYELIARLDADDTWCDGKIEKQLARFVADPDLTIVGTGMTRVDEHDAVIDQHIRPGDWNGILRFFVEVGCPFPHGSVVARADIYRLLGGYPYDALYSHCEDFALWGSWLRFFKPAMIEESLYRYTVSKSSVSLIHQRSQARASGVVHARFRELDLPQRLPDALSALSVALDVSILEAGALAFAMHRHGASVSLPEAAIAPLQVVLGDRDVVRVDPRRRRATPASELWLRAQHVARAPRNWVCISATGAG